MHFLNSNWNRIPTLDWCRCNCIWIRGVQNLNFEHPDSNFGLEFLQGRDRSRKSEAQKHPGSEFRTPLIWVLKCGSISATKFLCFSSKSQLSWNSCIPISSLCICTFNSPNSHNIPDCVWISLFNFLTAFDQSSGKGSLSIVVHFSLLFFWVNASGSSFLFSIHLSSFPTLVLLITYQFLPLCHGRLKAVLLTSLLISFRYSIARDDLCLVFLAT